MQLALPFACMCILLEVGASFCYHSQDLFSWFCFPFLKQEYSEGLWSVLETTGIAGNKGGLLASPSPDVRASSL